MTVGLPSERSLRAIEGYRHIASQSARGIGSVSTRAEDSDTPVVGKTGESDFSRLLADVVSGENKAGEAVDHYAIGKSQDIHQTMISLAKADIGLTLLVGVRNKLLDAYQQIMRMS